MLRFISLFFSILLLCAPAVSYAQNASLPKLSADKNISTGKLPNGITYYFASNSAVKGATTFAFVQKVDQKIDSKSLRDLARKRFSSVGFRGEPLEKFLARNCMYPSSEGYISTRPGAIIYHFGSLPSALGDAVLDSTLFAVMAVANSAARDGMTSASQALIASGGFDSKTVLSKLKVISMVCPAVAGAAPKYKYLWNPDSIEKEIRVGEDAVARISATWKDARTPDNYMASVLPVISGKMANELGWVIHSRLFPAFREAGLPVYIDYKHLSSVDGIGDEEVVLTVNCQRSLRNAVKDVMTEELNRLYTWGADVVEYSYARDANKYRWNAEAKGFFTPDREFVDKCASAFLYGASLSTEKEKMAFAYREMPDTAMTRLFNNYMRHLLGQNCRNDISLALAKPLPSRTVIEKSLNGYAMDYTEKKLPKDQEEYVTGGKMWTFAGGINVIYKKMSTDGMLYYSYAVKGGRQWADPDYFTCLDDVPEVAFNSYLASAGIEQKLHLTPSDIRLTGSVPVENTSKMLQILAALSHQEENDKVFDSKTYKLLILVGDREEIEMETLVSKYVYALRPGGKWTAAGSVDEFTPVAEEDDDDSAESVVKNFVFPLDRNSANTALCEVGKICLEHALAKALEGHAAKCNVSTRFVGYPSNYIRLSIKATMLPEEYFGEGEYSSCSDEIYDIVGDVMTSLSRKPVSASQLKLYVSMAENRHSVISSTPWYLLTVAADRYLDNRDNWSKFTEYLKKITAEDLKKFYAAATVTN